MTWNYRVLAFELVLPEPFNRTEIMLEIRSVYYNDDNTPKAYRATPEHLWFEEEDGIRSMQFTLTKMKNCLKKPILWGGDKWPQEYKPEKK